MIRRKQPVHERIDQAEELFLTLMGPDATPDDWDRFEYLARTSMEHRKLFAQYELIWQSLDQAGMERVLRKGLAEEEDSVVHMNDIPDATSTSAALIGQSGWTNIADVGGWFNKLRWAWAIPASVLALLLIGSFGIWIFDSDTPRVLRYETQTGEHRAIELADGSALALGARTTIDVRYTDTTRLIELKSGEVLSTVAHGDERPFILVTDDIMLMATGTSFNVRNGSAYSTVSVVQGSVSVVLQTAPEGVRQSRPRASAPAPEIFNSGTSVLGGQQLRAAKNAELGLVREIDIDRVVSWQSGQLYFLEDDLATVFEDVMRYSDVTFMLMDQAVGDRIFTGSFRADGLEAWLDAMERAYSLKVTRVGDDWIAIAPAD